MDPVKYVIVDIHDKIVDYQTDQNCLLDPSLIRRSVHLIALNQRDEIVLAQRSGQQQFFPGHYETSANTYVPQGQSCAHVAYSLKDEHLGLVNDSFRTLDKYFIDPKKYPQFAYLYFVKTAGPFHYAEDRTAALKFMDKQDLAMQLEDPRFAITPCSREVLKIFLEQYAAKL